MHNFKILLLPQKDHLKVALLFAPMGWHKPDLIPLLAHILVVVVVLSEALINVCCMLSGQPATEARSSCGNFFHGIATDRTQVSTYGRKCGHKRKEAVPVESRQQLVPQQLEEGTGLELQNNVNSKLPKGNAICREHRRRKKCEFVRTLFRRDQVSLSGGTETDSRRWTNCLRNSETFLMYRRCFVGVCSLFRSSP